MDYLGVAMLGAIFGFGLHAILSAGPRDDLESEIARLNDVINPDAKYMRGTQWTKEERERIKAISLKRIQREKDRGHGTPAGEA